MAGWLMAAAVAGCAAPTGGGSGGQPGSTGGAGTGGNTATASGGSGSGGATAGTGGSTGSGGMVPGGASGGATGSGGAAGPSAAGGATVAGSGGAANGGAGGGGAGIGGAGGRGGAVGAGGRGGAAGGGTAGTTGGGGAGGTSACLQLRAGTGGTRYCSNARGELSNGYAYERWAAGQGSGCLTVYGVNANYSANWTESSDFLARAGLRFDSTKTHTQLGIVTADFAESYTEVPVPGATSKIYVALYGWTLEPLTEYYIIDDYGDFVPGPVNSDGSPRTNYGTITADGGVYDIWAMPVKNRPAITGDNKDFTQIFSVRKERRKCGRISVSEHFTKWVSVGLPFGKLEEAMFLMEAQNNSGTINVAATVTVK